jgi:hypothetical protein
MAAGCILLISACSSSSNGAPSGPGTTGTTSSSRLSPAAYKQDLKKIARQESRAQHTVQSAFHAKTAAAVRQTLGAFADDQQRVSGELTALVPPADAQAANAALARAFADNAAATRAVVHRMAHAMTVKAALHIIQTATQAQRSGHEIDAALGRLRKLGYTAGS